VRLPGQDQERKARAPFRRRLLEYVRLLPDADVQVKLGENHWASLICGRSRTRIAECRARAFPELPEMPEVLAQIR